MELRKVVIFNSEKEADLIRRARSLPNFSGWVKAQLRKMEQQGSSITVNLGREDK